MDEIKCIACHKLNSAGDRFCAACGSSLDLKLCTSCEAINNPVADHCHSCGKPLAAQATARAAVEVSEKVSETPFYAPRRWEVYDARPSLGTRLARLAKATVLVALPLAAIGVWAYQFHGERLLRLVMPAAPMPVAEIQTKITPVPLVVLSPAAPPVAAAPAKQPVPEVKRTPKPAPAPVARMETARGVTHTLTGTAAVVDEAAAVTRTPQPAADVAPVPAAARGRVTHTRATMTEEVKPAVPQSTPVRPRPSAACPQTQAILGLCTANTKREGS